VTSLSIWQSLSRSRHSLSILYPEGIPPCSLSKSGTYPESDGSSGVHAYALHTSLFCNFPACYGTEKHSSESVHLVPVIDHKALCFATVAVLWECPLGTTRLQSQFMNVEITEINYQPQPRYIACIITSGFSTILNSVWTLDIQNSATNQTR